MTTQERPGQRATLVTARVGGRIRRDLHQCQCPTSPDMSTHGKCGRQLGLAIVVTVLVAIGCARPKSLKHTTKAPAKPPIPAQVVNFAPGNTVVYGMDRKSKKRVPLWHIEWKTAAQADVTSLGDVSQGAMEGVTGYVVDQGKPGATFSADQGTARLATTKAPDAKARTETVPKNQASDSAEQTLEKENVKELALTGHVHMNSKGGDSKASAIDLYCDHAVYDSAKRQIRAQGHVRIVSHVGTIGPVSQLWATPDLKLVATPSMFSAR